MIIAIDHGNSEIKTVHEQFTAGFEVYDKEPPLTSEVLEYGRNYYALTRTRLPYRYDKTENDDYYILTLFAVGKELLRQNITTPVDVQLAVGLPPRYYSHLKDSFSPYFTRNFQTVNFSYAHQPFTIRITDVFVFPQCWGALITQWDEISTLRNCVGIDIGGYTVDIVPLHNGMPDMEHVSSLSRGVINLISEISEELEARTGSAPDDAMITDVISGKPSMLPETEKQFILETTRKFTDKLIYEIAHEKHVNAAREQVYYTGGGSILLKNFLDTGSVRFISDPKANAQGYEIVAGGLPQKS